MAERMASRIPKPEKRKGGILGVQIRVPDELQRIVGQKVMRRSTSTKDERVYYQRAGRHVLEIDAILQTARDQLAPPRWVFVRPPITRHIAYLPCTIERGVVGHRVVQVAHDAPDPTWQDTEPADAPPIKLAGCTTEAVLEFLITDAENPPKRKALQAKRRAMAALFAFRRKPDDVTLITGEDMQEFKEHLVKTRGNTYARKYLEDICAVLRTAADNIKIKKTDNPADAITLPGKRDGTPRPAFSEEIARKLLLAARNHALPIVRWGTRFGADLGLITSEFADANCRDVVIDDDGVPCLCIRSTYRSTDVKGLKTKHRIRFMPLPTSWTADFLAYVDGVRRKYGENAPLFADIPADRRDGQRNHKASAEIMKFIRGQGIENITDPETGRVTALQDSYSWRHRFASKLESIASVIDPNTGKEIANKSDRQRYLTGHAGKDVHSRVYLEHPPRETRHIIDAIPDPTMTEPAAGTSSLAAPCREAAA